MGSLDPSKDLQFTSTDGVWSNRNRNWLEESDLIIYWRSLPGEESKKGGEGESKSSIFSDGEEKRRESSSPQIPTTSAGRENSPTSPFLFSFTPKKETDYVIVGGEEPNSRVDIPTSSKTLPLLLARLAMVFELFDPQLDSLEECEFLREELNGVRIKPELANHNTTLEEVAGLLYLVEKASKISVIIGEETPEQELTQLFKFLSTIGLLKGRVGVFSPLPLSDFTDLTFCEE